MKQEHEVTSTMKRIKSPQLYRLSYQPETLVFTGEHRASTGADLALCARGVPVANFGGGSTRLRSAREGVAS